MKKIHIALVSVVLLLLSISSFPNNLSLNDTPSVQTDRLETDGKNYGGHLRIANEWSTSDMNPYIDFKAFSMYGEHPIYSPLFRSDENGTLRPCLAINYTTTNGVDFVINLVNNASFHSGAEFTANDAIATLQMIMDNNDSNLDSFWNTYVYHHGLIESIEKLNDYSFIIHLNQTYIIDVCEWPDGSWSNFVYLLDRMPMLRKNIVSNGLEPGGEIDGTGPYKLSSLNLGKNMTLIVNTDYFKGRAYLDNITYRWDFSVDEFPEKIVDNEIDLANFAYEFADPDQVSAASSLPGVSSESIIDNALWFVLMNFRNQYLANLTIRQAIAKAINKQMICNDAFEGYSVPAISYVCPGHKDWYDPNVPEYSYNPIEAQEVLGNLNLNLTLIAGIWEPHRLNTSRIIAQNLIDVGINLTVRELSWDDFFAAYYSSDFDLAIEDRIWLAYDPDVVAYELWYTDWWLTPIYGFSNSTIDNMIEQARITLDKTEKQKLHNWIQGNISYLAPMVFLGWNELTMIQNNDFYGIAPSSCINLCDSISLEKIYYKPTLSSKGNSPMHFCIIDSEGRRVGKWNGTIYEEIPGSIYRPEEKLTLIPYPEGEYRVVLNGTGNGTYSFEFVSLGLDYRNAPLSPIGVIREGQVREYRVTVSPDGSISIINCAADLDSNKKVEIYDVVRACGIYGATPFDANWNAVADIAPPIDKINIYDIVQICAEYGKKWSD